MASISVVRHETKDLPPSKAVTVVVIPLYRDGEVTIDEAKLVQDLVQNKHGAKSLHPDVVGIVANGKKDREGPIAYQILREILLAEHTVAQHYYDLLITTNIIEDDEQLKLHRATLPTPYTKSLCDEIEKHGGLKTLKADALLDLMEDLYGAQDAFNVFGYPAHVGPMAAKTGETRQQPLRLRKGGTKLQLAPLVKEALGSLIDHFALVVVDADYTYYGHVYMGPYMGLAAGMLEAMGIRTSMVNLACRTMKDIADKIFHGILTWGHPHGFTSVRALKPFDSTHSALLRAGFVFDKPWSPILIYNSSTAKRDITVKQYGPCFVDKLSGLLTGPALEADAAVVAHKLEISLAAARDHLRFRLSTDPSSLLTSSISSWV